MIGSPRNVRNCFLFRILEHHLLCVSVINELAVECWIVDAKVVDISIRNNFILFSANYFSVYDLLWYITEDFFEIKKWFLHSLTLIAWNIQFPFGMILQQSIRTCCKFSLHTCKWSCTQYRYRTHTWWDWWCVADLAGCRQLTCSCYYFTYGDH